MARNQDSPNKEYAIFSQVLHRIGKCYAPTKSLPIHHHKVSSWHSILSPEWDCGRQIEKGYHDPQADQNHTSRQHQRLGNATNKFNHALAVAHDNNASNHRLVEERYAQE
jgi:hypothetical protein